MNRLLGIKNYLLIALALLTCCVIECVIFNYRYITQWLGDYEQVSVVAPNHSVVLQPDQLQINYDSPDLVVRNVKLTVQTFAQVNENITGKLYAKTDANSFSYFQVGNFIINPRREFSATDNISLSTDNKILNLTIAFDKHHNPIKITEITLNAPYNFNFNLLRFILLAISGLSLIFIFKYRLYQKTFTPELRAHRWLNYGTLLVNIAVVLLIFGANNPITGDNVKTSCMFPQLCTESLGSDTHSLLQPRPSTAAEIIDSPLYVQQLDAWLKGQLHLDIIADSRISAMDNPRDATNFYRQQIGYPFDRTYYNDKWYSYYGISPLLMVYIPVYFVSSQVPTPILVSTILVLLAIIGIHTLITTWCRSFGINGNLLLFLLIQLTVPAVGRLYYLQVSLTHYYFAIIASIFWVCLYVICLLKSFEYTKEYQRNLILICAGISIVMVVMSRPHVLLLALTFSMPLALFGLKAWREQRPFLNFKNMLSLSIPVVLGALFVMWYNYVRFDSPFEFGQQLVITAMNIYDYKGGYDITILSNLFYHIFLGEFDYKETFPFIARPEFDPDDKTNYMFGQAPFGYFAFPIMFALFLLICKLRKQTFKQAQLPLITSKSIFYHKIMHISYGALFAIATLVIFFSCMWGPVLTERFVTDGVWVVAFVAAFLILEHINYHAASKSSLILYVIAVTALIKSLGLGILLSCIGPNSFDIDRSLFIYFFDAFRPFAY